MREPVGSAIVVTAQSFNPSIFTQVWMTRQNLVAEGDFAGQSVTTPLAAQHDLTALQLLVVPQRLQVTLKPDDEASAEAGRKLVDGVVTTLPHTPLQALGVNLDYLVTFEEEEFVQVDRALFLAERAPFAAAFGAADSRFGGYFSRDIDGIRMKLEVKPVNAGGEVGVGDKLRCSFNFHRALAKGDAVKLVKETLSRWAELNAAALRLVEMIEKFKA